MVHMFQQLELLGAASQQHVPTFARPGAVGAALHLEALNFEQNQLKTHSKSLKISRHSFFWPIPEGFGERLLHFLATTAALGGPTFQHCCQHLVEFSSTFNKNS